VRVPLSGAPMLSANNNNNDDDDDDGEKDRTDIDTWQWWNALRVLCDHHASLAPVLELTEDLPSDTLLSRYAPLAAHLLSILLVNLFNHIDIHY
jgi:hypothetical protein